MEKNDKKKTIIGKVKKMPPDPKEQLKIFVESYEKNSLQVGDIGFLLSFRWFKKWMQMTGYKGEKIAINFM